MAYPLPQRVAAAGICSVGVVKNESSLRRRTSLIGSPALPFFACMTLSARPKLRWYSEWEKRNPIPIRREDGARVLMTYPPVAFQAVTLTALLTG